MGDATRTHPLAEECRAAAGCLSVEPINESRSFILDGGTNRVLTYIEG